MDYAVNVYCAYRIVIWALHALTHMISPSAYIHLLAKYQ